MVGRPYSAAGAGLAVILSMYVLDPYSWGAVGGDVGFESNSWQIAWAAVSVVLITMAMIFLSRNAPRIPRLLVCLEFLCFVLVNWILISRDGFWTRVVVGAVSTWRPFVALCIGLIVRVLLLYLLRRMSPPPTLGASSS